MITTLTQKDRERKSATEELLILKLTRAKGEQDLKARVYEPGEHIRISGEGKLQILAMQNATRDLGADPGDIEGTAFIDTKSKKIDVNKLDVKKLQAYAKDLGIETKGLTKNTIIKKIKDADK